MEKIDKLAYETDISLINPKIDCEYTDEEKDIIKKLWPSYGSMPQSNEKLISSPDHVSELNLSSNTISENENTTPENNKKKKCDSKVKRVLKKILYYFIIIITFAVLNLNFFSKIIKNSIVSIIVRTCIFLVVLILSNIYI